MKTYEAQVTRTVTTTACVTVTVDDDADDDVVTRAVKKAIADDLAKAEDQQSISWELDDDDVEVDETDDVTE